MSLSNKKARETPKGKKKCLPKLKTILANPYKEKSPVLNEDELLQLHEIIEKAIQDSKLEPKAFVSNKHIHLGLDNCLRTINQQMSSCVLISLSIKPAHIVSLIARNAEIKDNSQPIYAQPKLEEFTDKLFGIKSLCMVLPLDLNGISEELNVWVNNRRKSKKPKEKPVAVHKNKSKKIKLKKPVTKMEVDDNGQENNKTSIVTTTSKSWSGDFISFDQAKPSSKLQLIEDKEELLEKLTEMIDNVPIAKDIIKPSEKMDVETENKTISISAQEIKPKLILQNSSEDSDDFLGEYQSLTVHKIRPNPNKKPKKKRKKNNKNLKKYLLLYFYYGNTAIKYCSGADVGNHKV